MVGGAQRVHVTVRPGRAQPVQGMPRLIQVVLQRTNLKGLLLTKVSTNSVKPPHPPRSDSLRMGSCSFRVSPATRRGDRHHRGQRPPTVGNDRDQIVQSSHSHQGLEPGTGFFDGHVARPARQGGDGIGHTP